MKLKKPKNEFFDRSEKILAIILPKSFIEVCCNARKCLIVNIGQLFVYSN